MSSPYFDCCRGRQNPGGSFDVTWPLSGLPRQASSTGRRPTTSHICRTSRNRYFIHLGLSSTVIVGWGRRKLEIVRKGVLEVLTFHDFLSCFVFICLRQDARVIERWRWNPFTFDEFTQTFFRSLRTGRVGNLLREFRLNGLTWITLLRGSGGWKHFKMTLYGENNIGHVTEVTECQFWRNFEYVLMDLEFRKDLDVGLSSEFFWIDFLEL